VSGPEVDAATVNFIPEGSQLGRSADPDAVLHETAKAEQQVLAHGSASGASWLVVLVVPSVQRSGGIGEHFVVADVVVRDPIDVRCGITEDLRWASAEIAE
jgi:hypothetical protein